MAFEVLLFEVNMVGDKDFVVPIEVGLLVELVGSASILNTKVTLPISPF